MVSIVLVLALPVANGPAEPAIDAVRSTLSRHRPPWYDRRQDGIASFIPKEEKPERVEAYTGDGQLAWLGALARGLIYLLGAILVASLAYFLITTLRNARLPSSEAAASSPVMEAEIEALPARAKSPRDLLEETRRAMERQDWGRAILFYFSYQLFVLDRANVLRLAKGKTNRRYLAEVGRNCPDVLGTVRRSTRLFEESFFGQRPPTGEAFQAVWNERGRIEAAQEGGR